MMERDPVSYETQSSASIGIVLADDHPVVRIGLRTILQADPTLTVLGEAADGKRAIDLVRTVHPNVLLLDLSMPECSGIEVLRQLSTAGSGIRVLLVVSSIQREELLTALQLGVRGVVLKEASASELIDAIHAVIAGEYWIGQHVVGDLVNVLQHSPNQERKDHYGLTSRELQITAAIVEGCANKDIAQMFSITEDTVKRHLKNIFDKLGVSSRLELAMFAINHHLVDRS